jgi:DNA-binding LacI/PurR family transcriptional regulator
MDALRHEFALRIPADVCVVGFDDIEPAAWESYNLTTFRQPMEQVADQIEELLNKRAPDVGERFVIQPFPVWRKSVRPAPSPVSS